MHYRIVVKFGVHIVWQIGQKNVIGEFLIWLLQMDMSSEKLT